MRTLLSQFCEDFEGVMRPLLGPLELSADALAASKDPTARTRILPELRERRHQIRTLVDKVAEQQAFVLIFGPLKSGKSTLMNAVSAAYVSEVSSLPAYPCMVFVSHADTRSFVLTKYNGKVTSFSDPAAMRLQVGRAHTELATRIREVEEQGEEFDPALHFAESLRRIDVKVPAGDLEQSGAVLVDTPGLYSRMKFGYDRMTREFRDTAACAIFVVKTENLFLEQVFEEFQELLALFSRIFLVVNLDTAKSDLLPDGSLVPSLERKDPLRIIEAFENLAMTAPLKAAVEEGRLRIYPVDLQQAASTRLQIAFGKTPDESNAGLLEGQADFDSFLGDLTDYLNSTDYLVAFLGDSLRHAQSLLSETKALCDHEALQELARRVDALETEKARTTVQAQVLDRLAANDWQQSVDRLRDQLLEETGEDVGQIRKKTHQALRGALESWFNTDASLDDLISHELTPLYASSNKELEQTMRESLTIHARGGTAGLELGPNLRNDLQAAGLHLERMGRAAMESLDPRPGKPIDAPTLDSRSVPVKKRFWDWILFRSKARVNKSVFGASERPTRPVPRGVKSRRLGRTARAAMERTCEEHLSQAMAERVKRLSRFLFGDYAQSIKDALESTIETERSQNTQRLQQLVLRLEEEGLILDRLTELRESLRISEAGVEDLATRYGETDPMLLRQPLTNSGSEAGEQTIQLDEEYEIEPQPSTGLPTRLAPETERSLTENKD